MTTTETATQRRWARCAQAAVALLAIVPFLLPFHQPPLQSFYQEWVAFALGGAAFVGAGLMIADRRIEAPKTVLLPLGLAILVAVQISLGRVVYWQQGVLAMLYLLWAAAMLVLGLRLRRRLGWDRFAALLAWALFAGAMATVTLAAGQFAGWNATGWVMPLVTSRLYGNLGQPNHFADYLALGLISVGYLTVSRRINLILGLAASTVLLAGLNLSGSRALWIYLAAALLIACWLHVRQRNDESRRALVWSGLVVVILVAIQPLMALLLDSAAFSTTVSGRLFTDTESVSDRLQIWRSALLMFREAPIIGVGFAGFAWHYFETFERFAAGAQPGLTDNAHNILLQLLAEFGLFGGLLLALSVLVWLVAQRRQALTAPRWWALCLIATLAAHSLLEYPLWYAYFLGVFAIILGATEESGLRFGSHLLDRLAFAAAAMIAVWTLATVIVDYRRVEALARIPEDASEAQQIEREALSVHRTSLLAHIVEMGLVRTIRLDSANLRDKLALNGRVLQYLPIADVAFRQSALYALSGNYPAAYRQWDLAVASYPGKARPAARELDGLGPEERARLLPLVEYAASRGKE